MKHAILGAILLLPVVSSLALADCKSDIQALMKLMEKAGPFRVDMNVKSAGQDINMTSEVVLPDSMRLKGGGIEMVMTPNGVWMGRGGPLQKMPDSMREQIQSMIRQGINMGVQAVEQPECLGRSEYEGGTYNLYKFFARNSFMGIESTANVAIYVNSEGKPVWQLIDGESMGRKSKIKQRITFDSSITIADP